jgi:excisionase family DNA binding protein
VIRREPLGSPDQGAMANRPAYPARTRHSRARRKREPLVQNTTPENPGKLVTLQELAIYLNVSPTVLYRLIKWRQLPSFKVGRQWRLELERVQDWLIDRYDEGVSLYGKAAAKSNGPASQL